MELLLPMHTHLTSMDYKFILKFTDRTIGDVYSDGGRQLKLQIKILVSFYQSVDEEAVVSKSSSEPSYKPGVYKFLDDFIMP